MLKKRNKDRKGSLELPLYFILCSPRSGSTLLMRILNSHTQIASPCEICIPYVVLKSWKILSSLKKMRKICLYYGVGFSAFPFELLFRPSARKHLLTTVRAVLEQEGKQTLVIKDPRHGSYPERIERLLRPLLPRYVILHRDARGVAHSFRYTLGRSLEYGFKMWEESTSSMISFSRNLPQSRVYELKFESLLTSPAETIKKLLNFMGYDFEPEMINYGRFDHVDNHLDLWGKERLIARVKEGLLNQSVLNIWKNDPELEKSYRLSPQIVELNQTLGYDE